MEFIIYYIIGLLSAFVLLRFSIGILIGLILGILIERHIVNKRGKNNGRRK